MPVRPHACAIRPGATPSWRYAGGTFLAALSIATSAVFATAALTQPSSADLRALTPGAPLQADARSAGTALPDSPTFRGRPLRPIRTVNMVVTAYCPGKCCCGPNAKGITASGQSVRTNGMMLAAADPGLPFGTLVSVPGYDLARPVPILDRGSAIKGDRLDVLMPTHQIAKQWGRKTLLVTIWEYAD